MAETGHVGTLISCQAPILRTNIATIARAQTPAGQGSRRRPPETTGWHENPNVPKGIERHMAVEAAQKESFEDLLNESLGAHEGLEAHHLGPLT